MNNFLKAGCLAIYGLAFVALFVPLPLGANTAVQYLALFLLAAHAVEMLLFFKKVKLYPGSLATSLALTLLFGFLHWLPLATNKTNASR
jgi:uncharacterized protein YhhL (DUF1145 family)